MTQRYRGQTQLALLSAAVLAATFGCGRSGGAAGPTGARGVAGEPTAANSMQAGERPGGAAEPAPYTARPGTMAAADDDEVDHWKGVPFDVHNFDEVLDYVATFYIDSSADRKRAWTEASNFALMTLEPPSEILPVAFYQQRKGIADEEGRLDGTTEPFLCRGVAVPGVVLHHIPADDYLKAHQTTKRNRRLSNEEVQALRARLKARNHDYHEAWKPIAFSRSQFDCAVAYAGQRVAQWKAEAARKPAPALTTAAVAPKKAAPAATTTEAAPKGGPADPAARGDAKVRPSDPARAEAAAASPVTKKGGAPAGKPATGHAQPYAKPATDSAKAVPADDEEEDKPKPPPDMNRVWIAAASGYLYALDPHSSVIPKEAWKQSTDETQDASFEGIGAVLTQRDDVTIVENPMEGRPAWRAGVRAGDVIHKVDGVDVSGWMLHKVVKLIRGPKATRVTLTISRESDPEPRDVGIMREHIDIKNVDGHLIKDFPGIAHIKMTGFIPESTKDLRAMLEKLQREAPGGQLKGIVLDLRNNSGGLLNKAIEVADMFLPAGRIVSVRSRRRPEEIHDATPSSSDIKTPLVVLVNDSSASASEIVASAIQDNGRGLVIGLRTFGKASVQTLFEPALHTDYYIKLTVARYYAPNGSTIQVVGVTPDVEVPPEADGKMPVGFREENLNNHLVPIQGAAASPWQPVMTTLNKCVDAGGQALKVARREPKPQIHPDFQLLRAADYLACLARNPQAAAR